MAKPQGVQMLILMFCKKPSMLVTVASDASVRRPSSVRIGVSNTDFIDTAMLAHEAITFVSQRYIAYSHRPLLGKYSPFYRSWEESR